MYVTRKRTGWELNSRPVSRKSNALPQRHHATQWLIEVLHRLQQIAIHETVSEWHKRLQACVYDRDGRFELLYSFYSWP